MGRPLRTEALPRVVYLLWREEKGAAEQQHRSNDHGHDHDHCGAALWLGIGPMRHAACTIWGTGTGISTGHQEFLEKCCRRGMSLDRSPFRASLRLAVQVDAYRIG